MNQKARRARARYTRYTFEEIEIAMFDVVMDATNGRLDDIEMSSCYAHAFDLLLDKLTEAEEEETEASDE